MNKNSAAKKELVVSPILLCCLIIGFIVIVHSVSVSPDFSRVTLHTPASKAIFAAVLFFSGLTLAALYGLASGVPLLVAASGRTQLAQELAKRWVAFTKAIGRDSPDHVEAQLNASRICRLNADFDEALGYLDSTMQTIVRRREMLSNLPEPKSNSRRMQRMSALMDRMYDYQEPKVYHLRAFCYYDKGDFEEAICNAQTAVSKVRNVRLSDAFEAKRRDQNDNILTKDLIEVTARPKRGDKRDQHLAAIEASTLELLGTIAAVKRDARKTITLFEEALELRTSIGEGNESLLTINNYGFAYLLLDEANQAQQCLEKIANKVESTNNKQLIACFLTNLGEAYRRLKDYHKAKLMLERSLSLKTKLYPAFHPDIAETNHYLGRLYSNLGDKQRARMYFDQAIKEPRLGIGSNHPLIRQRLDERTQLGL